MPALRPGLALTLLAAPALAGGGRALDEAAVLSVLNAVRQNPGGYADFLRRAADGYQNNAYVERDGTEHATYEGTRAVEEAARVLAAARPLPALESDPILTAAARDHAEAQGRAGSIGHVSSAGSSPGARVRSRGGDIYVVEAISYGMRSPEAVVRQWMVDDGVVGRGHRKLLMTGFYRYAGIWCGPHAGRTTMCVIDLSATPGGRPVVPAER
ncbi:CAP domain-containing protein [Sphingomonas sp. KR1UV-12]|uniref:CAP domain-containing protein n=1 Tax=Sphingomonas aurea TaxID=3063994 RepID=A0ABT9EGB5_9SPHN|nr:CAP domain-containing protein [Sphingomonas sp. KR1UV-12]MDP1026012.1 CAP domain-containing protein [Sphingomonas sp. KR1UV-12]